jgi:catechol 2,3-dioxygenase-like lactoylglutathione lyase family enzyme
MAVISIDHIQLAIPEGGEDRARIFYADLLGFVEIPKPSALAGRGGAWLQAGSVLLHLGVDRDFHPARKAHPAFLVDDLESALVKIERAGYEIDRSQPDLDGYKRGHAYDPFGNRIELMEKT